MAKADKTLTGGEKILGVLSYFGFFCILPLVLKPKSEFCQFHGKQGLIITLIFLILSLFVYIIPAMRWVFGLTHLLLSIIGIVFAAQGKIFEFPIIGDMAKKLDFDE